MTKKDAYNYIQEYYRISAPTEEDDFLYTECLKFLIEEDPTDVDAIMELAWHYCDRKEHEAEVRYLEMAADLGSDDAAGELGYVWYYGQHGKQDYKKAFEYFSIAAKSVKPTVALWAKYKIADMYRFGAYVEKDEEKYKSIIRECYKEAGALSHGAQASAIPYPEIAYRMAKIWIEEGKTKKAAITLMEAKDRMIRRLRHNAFWGHLEVMGRIVRTLYEIKEFDESIIDFYDLFYLADKPCIVTFTSYIGLQLISLVDDDEEDEDENEEAVNEEEDDDEQRYEIEFDGTGAAKFKGKWYRSFEDLCLHATVENVLIVKQAPLVIDCEVRWL